MIRLTLRAYIPTTAILCLFIGALCLPVRSRGGWGMGLRWSRCRVRIFRRP